MHDYSTWELKPRRKKRKLKKEKSLFSHGIIIGNLEQSLSNPQVFKLHRSHLLENKVIVSFKELENDSIYNYFLLASCKSYFSGKPGRNP